MTLNQNARLSIAPMMDWTDRHCRYFHRLMSRDALLYTEMVTSAAVINGDRNRLLRFDPAEHPVALQLGGSDPAELAHAVRIVRDWGYDEVNLNVGCPSDRVQSGCFGAVLMRQPDLVAECVRAMRDECPVDVTVKCRIGVDDQDPEDALPRFLEAMVTAGVTRVTIHARKAWLQGLSPKQNRDVPPLDYPLVFRMKQMFPQLHISLNGGIATLEEAGAHLEDGLDGVMIGRAAYHTPAEVLLQADQRIFGHATPARSAEEVALLMLPYIDAHLTDGGRLNQITRHILGLFAGRPGARGWKRILSEGAHQDGAGPELVERALQEVITRAA
ncbi:tRNA dihydrouridine(20/20a) synthase DusA [Jannaschia sp. CCS1]|uniref:tRNA dihydrouridine(20/20a) synthase DusA n=1 Tax=Jannaschia sp. (strain CCS1) TaxID=290400 RepID=UPI000053ADAC|nr:tRNA dihydrouridine(20/20a) synthase DusA [Jannaschia sp. CCS1]ABD55055.1 tRNA-U16,U17-dihydrouridine synthase [Jannaschia sp. CCS1]